MPMIDNQTKAFLVKNKKYTPLSIAMLFGKYEKLNLNSSWYIFKNINNDLYIEAGGGTHLHLAILNNEYEEAAKLIELGFNINCQDNSGATPLHLAAATNNEQLTKLLIKNGADKNIKDAFQVTATNLSLSNLNLKNIWTIYKTKKNLSSINIDDINNRDLTHEVPKSESKSVIL